MLFRVVCERGTNDGSVAFVELGGSHDEQRRLKRGTASKQTLWPVKVRYSATLRKEREGWDILVCLSLRGCARPPVISCSIWRLEG